MLPFRLDGGSGVGGSICPDLGRVTVLLVRARAQAVVNVLADARALGVETTTAMFNRSLAALIALARVSAAVDALVAAANTPLVADESFRIVADGFADAQRAAARSGSTQLTELVKAMIERVRSGSPHCAARAARSSPLGCGT